MFEHTKAFSGFAVRDVPEAKAFYGETLGLSVSEEDGLLFLHIEGGTEVLAYPKPDHEPAGFTILNFPVDDIDAAVDGLVAKGIEPIRYDGMPQDDKGIMRDQGPDIAWFTDPFGNVLSVLQEK